MCNFRAAAIAVALYFFLPYRYDTISLACTLWATALMRRSEMLKFLKRNNVCERFLLQGFLLLLLLGLLGLSGCTATYLPSSFAELDQPKSSSVQSVRSFVSEHYRVETDAGIQVAEQVATFMERVLASYQDVLGVGLLESNGLLIKVYAKRRSFQKELARLGLLWKQSAGCYSPEPPAAIYLPWASDHADHPLITLIHEGTHQFAHRAALDNPLLNPDPSKISMPVILPFWLNEGVAQFMEGSIVTAEQLEVGRINPARLSHLQQLIRRNKLPEVTKLVGHRYDEPFSGADYSAAWGLTFALYHGLAGEGDWTGENLLPIYLAELTALLADETGDDGFISAQWVDRLSSASLKVFANVMQRQGVSLSDWDATWHAAMLDLSPDVPLGGLSN